MRASTISPAGKPACATLSCPNNPPHCILVVDNDGDIRQLNTDALVYGGYHVDAASDGAAAWDMLQVKAYDLLVTDNDMPKVTGVDLLRKLRAARMALPVLMATGALPEQGSTRLP
jgi:DNA-binding response OmpR family regulator